uniref:Uncharacterized protein n=1 Tax=Oryza nivara TaxID=4536 RepID=A0A0E0H2R6_ORYNI
MADLAPELDAPAQTFASEDGVPNVRARVLGGATSVNAPTLIGSATTARSVTTQKTQRGRRGRAERGKV